MVTQSLRHDDSTSHSARVSQSHERRVEAFYSKGAAEWFEFKRRRGEIPHSTWGLWEEGVTTSDGAFKALLADIVRRGRIGANDHVLDVGCGYGASSIEIQQTSRCAAVLGIDLTTAFVVHANTLIEESGKQGVVEVRRMRATHLELHDESYNVVVAIDCACHFDTRDRFLAESARVLRPGGRLVMLDLIEPEESRGGVFRRAIRSYMMRSWNVPEVNRYSACELRDRLVRAGFAAVEAEPVTSRMLPGAIASMRSREFRQAYAKTFGRFGDLFWQFILSCIAKIHTWRLGEFVMVSAVRT